MPKSSKKKKYALQEKRRREAAARPMTAASLSGTATAPVMPTSRPAVARAASSSQVAAAAKPPVTYPFVGRELRNIWILAVIMIGILVALSILFR